MSDATTVPVGTPVATKDEQQAARVKAQMVAGMTEQKAAAPVAQLKAVPRNIQIPPSRISGFEYGNVVWAATLESGWTLDDALDPKFWSLHAQKLRRYDKIEVRTDDGAFYADLLVTQVGSGFAFVHVLQYVQLDGAVTPTREQQEDGYEIRDLGPIKAWCVIRKSDAVVIREKSPTRRDAETWLGEYKERIIQHQAKNATAA
jgi:hypothetical protein